MNSKKKLLILLMTICLALCLVCLTACNDGQNPIIPGKDTPIDDGTAEDPDAIYYVVTVDDTLTYSSEKYLDGQTVTVTAPEIKNKLFICWNYQGHRATDDREYSFVVTEDAALRAIYAEAYTITLDAREGSVSQSAITVAEGYDYTLPSADRKNYYFVGWKWAGRMMTGADGVAYDAFDINKDVTFVAVYEEKPSFVVSVGNGEEDFVDYVYYLDEEITLEGKDMQAVGKKVVGWYEIAEDGSETLVTKDKDFSFVVDKDVKYELRYVVSFTIMVQNSKSISLEEYAAGDEVVVTLEEVPVGKNFVGWKYDDGEGIATTEQEFSFFAEKNLVIIAVFEDIDYTLTYVLDGVEVESATYVYNQEINVFIPTIPEHKDFSGWAELPTKMPAEDITVFGTTSWQKHELIVIDGSGSGKFDYGSEVSIEPKSFTGKRFLYWEITGAGQVYGDENGKYTFVLEKRTVITGRYENIKYALTYKLYGGDWSEEGETWTEEQFEYGDIIDIKGEPALSEERQGHYDFDGWYINGKKETGSRKMSETENVTVEGRFVAHTHRITVINGDIEGYEIREITTGWSSVLRLKADVPVGKLFNDWQEKDVTIATDEEFEYVVKGDAAITATFKPKYYTVKFLLTDADGSQIEYKTVNNATYGQEFPTANTPSDVELYEHKNFGGWLYEGGRLPETMFDAEDEVVVTGKLSWKKYSVVVEGGYLPGGAVSGTYEYGTEITVQGVIDDSDKTNWYDFSYWKDETTGKKITDAAEQYTFTVVGNVELSSHYERKTFTASFYIRVDDGEYELYSAVNFNYDKKSKNSLVSEPLPRQHYTFSGWSLADGSEIPDVFSPEDISIFGEYNVVSYTLTQNYVNTEKNTSRRLSAESYPYGSKVSMTAPDLQGETFLYWLNAGNSVASVNKTYEVTIGGDVAYTAVFEITKLAVTVPDGSQVSVKQGKYDDIKKTYDYGTVIVVTPPAAATGKELDYWTINGQKDADCDFASSVGANLTVTLYDDVTIATVYKDIIYNVYYRVSGEIVVDGEKKVFSVTDLYDFADEQKPNPQTSVYNAGVAFYAHPTAPEHYGFYGWYKDEECTELYGAGTTMPANDITVYGKFAIDVHTVEVKYKDGSGAITGEKNGSGEYVYGTTITLVPEEITGEKFVKWTTSGGETSTDISFETTITEDMTIIAEYQYIKYTVSYKIAQSTNGKLVYDEDDYCVEDKQYKYKQEVTVKPDLTDDREYYLFGGWYIDGKKVGSTFVMEARDMTVVGIYYSIFEYEKTGEDADTYKVKAVAEYREQYPTVLVVPTSYDGKNVVEVAEGGFAGISSTEITIPAGIETMGQGAFYGVDATKLTLYKIFDGRVDSIFGETVAQRLTTVELYVDTVPAGAMSGMDMVITVVLHGTVSIGADAMSGCTAITEIVLPDTITSIGDFAFSGLTALTTINYSVSGDAAIGQQIFGGSGASSGISITFAADCGKIPSGLFSGGTKLVSATIPEGITEICEGAFEGVTGLTGVTLPDSLTAIGASAFKDCLDLAAITINSGIQSIGAEAFAGCVGLATVNYNAVAATASNAFSNSGSDNSTLTIGASVAEITAQTFKDSLFENVVFAQTTGIEEIGEEGFAGSAIAAISLPACLKTLGKKAFFGCSQLSDIQYFATELAGVNAESNVFGMDTTTEGSVSRSVTIGSAVKFVPTYLFYDANISALGFGAAAVCTEIGSYAFGNNAIEILDLNNAKNIIKIGAHAFDGITATSVVLPYSVDEMGSYAFNNTAGITINCETPSARIGWATDWFGSNATVNYGYGAVEGDDYDYLISGDKLYLVAYNSSVTDVVLPTTLTIDGEEKDVNGFGTIFAGKSITSFSYTGDKITTIMAYAFENCTALTSVSVAGSPAIGVGAFKNCALLSTVELSVGETLPKEAFYGCEALSTLDLNSVKTIGAEALRGSGITSVNLSAAESIGEYALVECDSLSEIITGDNTLFAATDGMLIDITTATVISYALASDTTAITVPDSVTEIADYAFYGAKNITSLSLGAGLNTLGKYAFAGCVGLTSVSISSDINSFAEADSPFSGAGSGDDGLAVTIGDGVTTIPDYLFRQATLTSVDLGNGVESIGEYAFDGNLFTELTIPASVTKIGTRAFNGSTVTALTYKANIADEKFGEAVFGTMGSGDTVKVVINSDGKNVRVPKNFVSGSNVNTLVVSVATGYTVVIGDEAFKATKLTAVDLNEGISDIGDYAFADIDTLSTVTISVNNDFTGRNIFDNSGTSATTYAFGKTVPSGILTDKTEVTSVTLSDTVVIGEDAFKNSGLSELQLPDTVTYIGAYAFAGTAISSITVPASVESIGDYAFNNISTLTAITYKAIEANDSGSSNGIFGNLPSGVTVTIGAEVKKIPAYLFYPESEVACDKISSVTFESSSALTTIGAYAFAYLTAPFVGLPTGITAVKPGAFFHCSGLTSASIAAATEVGANAFAYCDALTSFVAQPSQDGYDLGASAFAYCSELTTVDLGKANSVGENAFIGCAKLVSVEGISTSASEFGASAFEGCSVLTTVDLAQASAIPSRMFFGCSALSVNSLPDSVTSIGAEAFSGCSSLTVICIPLNVENIGNDAYAGCDNVQKINYYAKTMEGFSASPFNNIGKNVADGIVFLVGAEVELIPEKLFCVVSTNNSQLNTDINITSLQYADRTTDTALVVGKRAFYRLPLTAISIPDYVTRIEEEAFLYCSAAETLTLGDAAGDNALTYIGRKAFGQMLALTTFYNNADKLPSNLFIDDQTVDAVYRSQDVFLNSGVADGFELIINASVKTIPAYMFNNIDASEDSINARVKSIAFASTPASLQSIGSHAFYENTTLVSADFGGATQLNTVDSMAFYGCTNLADITISGVKDIGASAFYNCTSLTSISLPKNLESIGWEAFKYCSGFASVTFGSDSQLTSIGYSAFEGCNSLTSITIPDGVTDIGVLAFGSCTSLNEITGSAYATSTIAKQCGSGAFAVVITSGNSIDDYAFYDCTGLTKVTIFDSVTSMGDSAFYGCYKLIEVHNKSSFEITAGREDNGYVGYYAKNVYTDDDGSKLSTDDDGYIIYTDGGDKILVGYTGTDTTLTLPNGITEINQYAFYNCSRLTSITIPDSVTSIGEYAFYNCSSLTSITIPDSVTSIGSWAFSGTAWYNNQPDGVIYAGKVLYAYKGTMPSNTSIEVKEGTLSITGYAFSNCSGLTSVTIPASVTSIGEYAFYNCSRLTRVTFGSGSQLTSIGNYAFYNCNSLTSITIPDSVTSIGDGAFEYCTGLTSVTFGSDSQLTSIGKYAFKDCSNLTSITISDSVTSIDEYAFYNCSSLTSVTIGNSVTRIGGSAFYHCIGLTSVTFGSGSQLTSIGYSAFENCWSLTSITIPDSVTRIGEEAFYNCSSLMSIYYTGDIAGWCGISGLDNLMRYGDGSKILYIGGEKVEDLVIPDGVTSIPDYAFYKCSSLTSITIPDSVTSIGEYVFNNCSSLTSVTIGSGVTSIGSCAFEGCSSLESITIPFVGATKDSTNTTYFGYLFGANSYSYNSYYVPSSLKSVVITGGTSIGDYAFYGCSSLTSVTIPKSVTSIGEGAFDGCDNLVIVYPEE